MSAISDSDIERILRVKNADLGLFVLAMHSLMERTLKEKYSSSEDFGTLIWGYINDFYSQHGTPRYPGSSEIHLSNEDWNLFKILKQIPKNHYLSNGVRHQFIELYREHAETTVACFLAFAKAEGWDKLTAIKKLQNELKSWDNHEKYESDELKKAIKEIEKLKSENDNLSQKANELRDLQSQLELISSREKILELELEQKKESLSKKDERLDELRQKTNEQKKIFTKEKQEILAKLTDYEETRKYLSVLEKVAFYTKTRHDYEKSIISLSHEQKEVLEQVNLNKDYLVKGAAGTGKSLVLIKALEKAVLNLKEELGFEESKNSFRLLTYTRSLVKYNQYVTKLLGTQVSENSITTADSFLFALLKNFYTDKTIAYNLSQMDDGIFSNESFSDSELFTEAEEFIWANCITKEQYIDEVCEREGMKFPLKKSDRKKMWRALEAAENKLSESNVWPRNFAAKKLSEKLLNGEGKEFISEYSFVDEAQDLPPVVLSVIKNSTNRSVFLAGDSDQSIYRKGFNWNRSGIDIKGRTKILKTNFRNTNQIHQYAEEYRNTFKNKDQTTAPDSFRPGPPVEHITCKNTDEIMKQMIQQIKLLINGLNYAEENICVIANQSKKLEKFKELLDKTLGIESNIIDSSFDFEKTSGVRLCTMQNCKGLDFPVVLLLADHRIQGAENSSAFDSETFMTQQFNLVYVALTRAMEMLYVYTSANSSYEPFVRLK